MKEANIRTGTPDSGLLTNQIRWWSWVGATFSQPIGGHKNETAVEAASMAYSFNSKAFVPLSLKILLRTKSKNIIHAQKKCVDT